MSLFLHLRALSEATVDTVTAPNKNNNIYNPYHLRARLSVVTTTAATAATTTKVII